MLFAVLSVFEKKQDNQGNMSWSARSFFPKSVYSADSFTDAYNQFNRHRFYRSGKYVLVLLKERDNDYDVCSVFEFPFHFVNPLYTREFKWDPDGIKCEYRGYFGSSPDCTEGDPEVLFKAILDGKPLSSETLDFGNTITRVFAPEDII